MKHLPTRDARRNARVCALAAAFHPAPVALELVREAVLQTARTPARWIARGAAPERALELVRVVALTVVPVAAGLVPMTAQEAVKGIV